MATLSEDIDAAFAGGPPVKSAIRAVLKRIVDTTAPPATFSRWDNTQRITYMNGALTTRALSANTMYLMPLIIGTEGTALRIGIEVVAGAAGAARLGIYNNHETLAKPSTLRIDAGTVNTGSAAFVEIIISHLLPAGLYWLALVTNAAPTIRALTSANMPWPMMVGLANTRATSGTRAFTYGTLPTDESAQTYTWAADNPPHIWVGG